MKYALGLIFVTCVLAPSQSFGAVTVSVNGASHTIPQTNEKGWGANVTAWIQAISQYTLQNSGGTFTLTAEVDTGATYGFKVPYIKTKTSTPSTAGVLRLAKTDSVGFRNNTNSSDLLLAINGADQLTFNGVVLGTASAGSFSDLGFVVFNDSDNTKKIALDASSITTGNTRTLKMADAAVDLADLTGATSLNTASKIVKRDGSGNFTAGTVTATSFVGALTGNASTVTTNANLSGDVSSVGNVTTIGATKVTNAMLAGSIDLTAKVTGALPIANGGTNNGSLGVDAGGVYYSDGSKLVNLAHGSSGNVLTSGGTGAPTWTSPLVNPMTTGGDIIYGGASGVVTRLANGTSGQVLQSAGGTSAPAWQTLPGNATALKTPTTQIFTSTGATAGQLFTVTSANATAGATYTNNGQTFTVLGTIAAGTSLYATGAGAPTASGTLTKASGTGDATITFSAQQALAAYTTPAGPAPLFLKVKLVGGGAGGTGGGSAAGGNGTAGLPSLLVNSVAAVVAGGGQPGVSVGAAGVGGSATITSPAIDSGSVVGGSGQTGGATTAAGSRFPGGCGGNSPFFGGGACAALFSSAGGVGLANTGGGGQGGGNNAVASVTAGSGGGSGAYAEAIVPGPSGTYYYAIGTGGTGGTAGTSGLGGGNGAQGKLIVEEHYQ